MYVYNAFYLLRSLVCKPAKQAHHCHAHLPLLPCFFHWLTWYGKCRICMYSASRSNIRTIWENMSTRWPVCFRRTSSLSNRYNFPLPRRRLYKWRKRAGGKEREREIEKLMHTETILTCRGSVTSGVSGIRTRWVWLQHFFSSITRLMKPVMLPLTPLLRAL